MPSAEHLDAFTKEDLEATRQMQSRTAVYKLLKVGGLPPEFYPWVIYIADKYSGKAIAAANQFLNVKP